METEEAVKLDADPACAICDGAGWHWGWNHYHDPVRLRCPCVDRNRPQPHIHISKHATERYRERVIACPERKRSDELLQKTMRAIMSGRLPKKFKKTNFLPFKPWGIFVFHRGYVATALGPGMPESHS